MIVAAALLVCAAAPAAGQGLTSGPYELPYKNTYVKEVFVAENEYRTARPERIEPLPFEQAREILPAPVWEGHDREIEMYWHAWRIAVGNIRQPQEGSGFVSPYLDIAYNGNIFMWDMSFMMMYARYGYRYFPFQRSLDNFYAKQHPDGFICREIRADGSDCFERYDPTSTGPDLLPWVELAYYRQFGDIERLHLAAAFDLVVDCCDNFTTRYLIDDACAACGRPWVYGSIGAFHGQVGVFNHLRGRRYADLYPDREALCRRPQAVAGVIGAVPAVIGALEASEALKLLADFGEPLDGRLFTIDLRSLETDIIEL